MKTIIIYYFSGTGNTKWAAEFLTECILQSGYRVECIAIEKTNFAMVKRQLREADQVILGFPVYGSTAPLPVLNFIENIPAIEKGVMPLAVFATHAMASGDSAYYVGSLLKDKGYDLQQTRHFVMMNNFHVPKFRFYKPDNGSKLFRKLEKAKPKIQAFADEIVREKKHIIGNRMWGHLLGNLQRRYIDRAIGMLITQFEVAEDRCSDCGLCVRICPMENILKTRDGITLGNNCAVCLRCYSQCPSEAILIGRDSANSKKYPRYKGPSYINKNND